jgi:phosphoglycolate phosphatase-like HAD superfamily hydrolase
MLRIITDFDGPIMDVSERYYQVYKFCLEKTRRPGQSLRELSKPEFWLYKRKQIHETQIALDSGLDEEQAQEFVKLRKKNVHTQPYFEYDRLIPGVVDVLSKVELAGIDFLVMTMRRQRELEFALNKYNLGKFFPTNRRYCLSNDYVKTRDIDDKPLLMARALKELPPATDIWMVGDTEADIISAKKHGVKIITVESGIRDRAQLEIYNPDYILNNMSEAVDFILNTSLQQDR